MNQQRKKNQVPGYSGFLPDYINFIDFPSLQNGIFMQARIKPNWCIKVEIQKIKFKVEYQRNIWEFILRE